jgi:hypothetical protein
LAAVSKVPVDSESDNAMGSARVQELGVELRFTITPKLTRKFFFVGKVFAAVQIEKELANSTDILVWMGEEYHCACRAQYFLAPCLVPTENLAASMM